jgi:hypothetical protein
MKKKIKLLSKDQKKKKKTEIEIANKKRTNVHLLGRR